MSDDIQAKRRWVSELYPNPKWARRVRKMSDDQVIAIYLDKQGSGAKPKSEKKRKVIQDETLF